MTADAVRSGLRVAVGARDASAHHVGSGRRVADMDGDESRSTVIGPVATVAAEAARSRPIKIKGRTILRADDAEPALAASAGRAGSSAQPAAGWRADTRQPDEPRESVSARRVGSAAGARPAGEPPQTNREGDTTAVTVSEISVRSALAMRRLR